MSLALLGGNRSLFPQSSIGIGFFIGSLLPDFDFIPLILLRFVDRDLALSFHRSFSHSFFFALFVLLVCVSLSSWKKDLPKYGVGVALGIAIHIALDVLLWYAPVYIFWPFDFSISLFDPTSVSDIYWNLVFATECLFYGTFIVIMNRIIGKRISIPIKIQVLILILISMILIPIGFHIATETFEIVAYGIALSLGFPLAMFSIRENWEQLFDR